VVRVSRDHVARNIRSTLAATFTGDRGGNRVLRGLPIGRMGVVEGGRGRVWVGVGEQLDGNVADDLQDACNDEAD